MNYSIHAFNTGTFWVPGPEVYWMQRWNQREEMNVIIYLVRGGGQNILINTGPPQDLTILNQAWKEFFGYPEAQIVRSEQQLPQNILRSQGLDPEDISKVIVTPLQAYATANIHLFRNAEICISIETARGTVILTDCFFKYGNIEQGHYLGVMESMMEADATWSRIRKEGRIVASIYDPEVFQRFPGGVVA